MLNQFLKKTVEEEEVEEEVEEVETEEVTSFAEIMPAAPSSYTETFEPIQTNTAPTGDRKLSELSKEELFDKLQNYKKLLTMD